MNRILSNIKYKITYQSVWAAWYVGIYLAIMIPLSIWLVRSSLINSEEGSLVYRIWGLALFQFAISIRFREDFDYLLTLSSTRREIFFSLLWTSLFFSAVFSGLIAVERIIIDYLNSALNFKNIIDPFHFFSPYAVNSMFLLFLFFFILCACCSVAGLLLGSMIYRFGRKFAILFWLVFASIPMVFFPMVLWFLFQQNRMMEFLTRIGEFLKNFDVLSGTGLLFLLAVVFSLAAYLNIRKLPQN